MSQISFLRPFCIFVLSGAACSAQLIAPGQPVPKRSAPPVVFVNGYQSGCGSSSDFAFNFSTADQTLQTINVVTLFFDNCTAGGTSSIETLGQGLGTFLASLKYDDGTSVDQVDVVAHSLGGLIVRSYLAGKQAPANASAPTVYQPPAAVRIRKAIFLGAPNFGTKVASILGSDTQTQEMSLGSSFLFDLNSWNAGTDDMRGVDVLSIAGNGGTGVASGVLGGYDDGLVSLPSSSVGFARPGRTRVVPYCHTASVLLYLFGSCAVGTPALNTLTDTTSMVTKLVLSFLSGTNDWQTLGQAIEDYSLANTSATVILAERTAADQPLSISGAQFGSASLSTTSDGRAFGEKVPGGSTQTVQATAVGNISVSIMTKAPAASGATFVLKDGPSVSGVFPASGRVFPLSLAPGEFVAVYGHAFAASTASSGQPYPTQLSDVQVTVNGTAVPLQYASSGQINAVMPDLGPGVYGMTVKNAAGQQTLTVFVEVAAPSVFTQNTSGSGAAAALNGVTGVPVTASAPLHAGDYVSLYLTGLGKTQRTNGFDYAALQPTVTVGGKACTISFAGRNPVFTGLDQINCQIPTGLTAGDQNVVVTSGTHSSNTVTVAVQ